MTTEIIELERLKGFIFNVITTANINRVCIL